MGYAIGCDMACHRQKNQGKYDNWESNNAVDVTPVPNLGTGTPVHSPVDGQITVSGWEHAGGWRLHISAGLDELYLAHFAGYAPGIGFGRQVKKGMVIAYMGSTGDSGSPHVHVASRNGTPTAYLEGLF
jgi:murein DD-endopeptidase MepM/ murein hydrolase activator NlpD